MKYDFLSLGRSEYDKRMRHLLGDKRVKRKRSEHVFIRFPYAHTVTAAMTDNLILMDYEL